MRLCSKMVNLVWFYFSYFYQQIIYLLLLKVINIYIKVSTICTRSMYLSIFIIFRYILTSSLKNYIIEDKNEIKKFDTSITHAMSRGIIDAIAAAGTFAITNYMDLGASLLILAYGGYEAMSNNGNLTVGNLITFQLVSVPPPRDFSPFCHTF